MTTLAALLSQCQSGRLFLVKSCWTSRSLMEAPGSGSAQRLPVVRVSPLWLYEERIQRQSRWDASVRSAGDNVV